MDFGSCEQKDGGSFHLILKAESQFITLKTSKKNIDLDQNYESQNYAGI